MRQSLFYFLAGYDRIVFMDKRLIFHVDVNSAFVSWEASKRVKDGLSDIRLVPSIVGGDPSSRTSIVAAKSIPAKKYGINTGEPVSMALRKCPELVIARPNFQLYRECSKAFKDICREYAPVVEEFSIDECFLDMTGTSLLYPDPMKIAYEIKNRIRDELGFTVNVGVGSNKLLAKMASDFEKPDKVHTLFLEEVPSKMWPLPVGDLLFVGKKTVPSLQRAGVRTIGDLAKMDMEFLEHIVGTKAALAMHNSANGIDDSPVSAEHEEAKGYSISTTVEENIVTFEAGYQILLKLCDQVASRMRRDDVKAYCIAVTIRDTEFHNQSHQRHLSDSTDITAEIYEVAKQLFEVVWDGRTPLRLMRVALTNIDRSKEEQVALFVDENKERQRKMDRAMDQIRDKFGKSVVQRGATLNLTDRPRSKD